MKPRSWNVLVGCKKLELRWEPLAALVTLALSYQSTMKILCDCALSKTIFGRALAALQTIGVDDEEPLLFPTP